MLPLLVADDIGRWLSNAFFNPGNELSWSFSIALTIVLIGGENSNWWWNWANSALVVVSWAFWPNSNSDALLTFYPPSPDLSCTNPFVRWCLLFCWSLYVGSSIWLVSGIIHRPVCTSLLHRTIVFPWYWISHKISLISTWHPALHSFMTDTKEWNASPGTMSAVLPALSSWGKFHSTMWLERTISPFGIWQRNHQCYARDHLIQYRYRW